jgi:hypothetical protein
MILKYYGLYGVRYRTKEKKLSLFSTDVVKVTQVLSALTLKMDSD